MARRLINSVRFSVIRRNPYQMVGIFVSNRTLLLIQLPLSALANFTESSRLTSHTRSTLEVVFNIVFMEDRNMSKYCVIVVDVYVMNLSMTHPSRATPSTLGYRSGHIIPANRQGISSDF